jgi:hypothetical protein
MCSRSLHLSPALHERRVWGIRRREKNASRGHKVAIITSPVAGCTSDDQGWMGPIVVLAAIEQEKRAM